MAATTGTDITQVNQQEYRNKYKKRIAISLTQKQAICQFQVLHPTARFQEINQALGLELERTTILKIVRNKDKWLGIDPTGSAGRKTCFRASRYAMINRATALWLQAEHPDFLRTFFINGYNVLPMSALARTSDDASTSSLAHEQGDSAAATPPSVDNNNTVPVTAEILDHNSRVSCGSSVCDYDDSTAALHSLSEAAADVARRLSERCHYDEVEITTDKPKQHPRQPPQLNPQQESEPPSPPSSTVAAAADEGAARLPPHEFLLRAIPSKALIFARLFEEPGFKASVGWVESFRKRLDLNSLPEIAATLKKLPGDAPPFYRVISPPARNMLSSSMMMTTTTKVGSATPIALQEPWTARQISASNHFSGSGESSLSVAASNLSVTTPTVLTDQQVVELVLAEFGEKSTRPAKRKKISKRSPIADESDGGSGGSGDDERVHDLDVGSSIFVNHESVAEPPQTAEHDPHHRPHDDQQQSPGVDEIMTTTRVVGEEQLSSSEELFQTITNLIRWMRHESVEYEFEDRQGFYRQLDSLREQIVQRAIANL
ncbi:hypothetical protein BGZ73_007830 [Actinomortierella ambigua]|nr:hypothetical protein BGZ73_007830 [Actinomortierella ambigua]